MNYKLYDNGQIMKVISEGHEVAHCMNKEIHFDGSKETIANTETPIQVKYMTFDLELGNHVLDTTVNKTVEIDIDGNKFNLPIVNGEGLIEFTSPNVGKNVITVENYRYEVIVNEG